MESVSLKKLDNLVAHKKVIVYGAGGVGSYVINLLEELGKSVLYLVDMDVNKQGKNIYGYVCYSPERILQENYQEVVVCIAMMQCTGAANYLKNLDLQIPFFEFSPVSCKKPDLFDGLLGYSRKETIEGFSIIGDSQAEKKIVILGNSTTDCSCLGVKTWPEFLYDKFTEKGEKVTLYNGAITGYYSDQELLKLLRDVLVIKPERVLVFSGIIDAVDHDKRKSSFMNKQMDTVYGHIDWNEMEQELGYADSVEKGSGIEDIRSKGRIWYDNMRIMHAICKEFSIKFHAFLQPCIWTQKKYGRMENRTIERLEQATGGRVKDFYKEVAGLIKEEEYVFDLKEIFDDETEIYYDWVHVGERGNRIIAENIFSNIIN